MKVIHSISDSRGRFIRVGRNARSRCGKIANVMSVEAFGFACVMTDAAGNQFYGTQQAEAVTCKKCINLQTVGTIHAKRTASNAKCPAARAARTHARP